MIVAPFLLLAAGAFLLWYRATMHNWPWQGDPARLSICDRDYYPEDQDVSGAQMRRDGIDPHHLFAVFRAPVLIGPEIYADASPAQRAAPRQPGSPCTGSLVIEDAPDRYRIYGLSGGP